MHQLRRAAEVIIVRHTVEAAVAVVAVAVAVVVVAVAEDVVAEVEAAVGEAHRAQVTGVNLVLVTLNQNRHARAADRSIVDQLIVVPLARLPAVQPSRRESNHSSSSKVNLVVIGRAVAVARLAQRAKQSRLRRANQLRNVRRNANDLAVCLPSAAKVRRQLRRFGRKNPRQRPRVR